MRNDYREQQLKEWYDMLGGLHQSRLLKEKEWYE